MPRNEAGVYVKPAGTTAIPNTVIASAPYNALQNDMADALTESLPRTGVAPMLAPLPMGGNPITDLGATSSASGAATVGQVGHVASRDTVAELIADEVLSYVPGSGLQVVEEGQRITAQGFRYEVLPASSLDVDIQTSAGVKLRALLTGGVAYPEQFGADGVDDTAAILAANKKGQIVMLEGRTYKMKAPLPWAAKFIGSVTSETILEFSDIGEETAVTVDKWWVSMQDLTISAKDWDTVRGRGMELDGPCYMTRVRVVAFPKTNILLRSDLSGNNGPYYANLKDVASVYSGQSGIVVGTGANAVTLDNPLAAWNGAPGHMQMPIEEGDYDGVLVTEKGEGNPDDAYPVWVPESLTITGGDAPYNSRYGWHFETMRNSNVNPGYCELNLVANSKVGHVWASTVVLPMGDPDEVATTEAVASSNPNQIIVAGQNRGSGYKKGNEFVTHELRNMRTELSRGSNSAIWMEPYKNGVGNLVFDGEGFQPTISFDVYETIIKRLTLGDGNIVTTGVGAPTHRIRMTVNGIAYDLLAIQV